MVDIKLLFVHRMFSHGFDNNYTRPNDRGEFEVAHGISAEIFSSIMVRIEFCIGVPVLMKPEQSRGK